MKANAQTNAMHMSNVRPTHKDADMSHEEIAHRYLGAYETQDRAMIEDVLAQDFVFSSPQDAYIDRDAYFEKCWQNAEDTAGMNIERVFSEGDEAYVQYVVTAKDGKRFRNVEYLRFNGPRIAQIDVYFGRTLSRP